jgi:phage-related protein (TIGR01555 family)
MRIRPEARALFGKAGGKNPFSIPPPMPGVLPPDAPAMAMDSDICSVNQWAIQQFAGQYGWDGIRFIGYPRLAELAQRAEYRRISETYAKEATRKWLRLVNVGKEDKLDVIKAIDGALKKFRVRDILREAILHDGLFGRGQIYADTGAGDNLPELRTPLLRTRQKVKLGSLRGFKTIEPLWTYPGQYNASDPLHPNFYNPETWYVQGKEIHRSRLFGVVSREVPDLLKPAYLFGGLSLSQMAIECVENWLRTRKSVGDLVNAFSTMVLSTDIQALLSNGGGDAERARADLFNAIRGNLGLMIVNKATEELSNVSTPLGGLDHLQAQSQEHISGVSGIPLVKMFGITPTGLNASSEGELRVWYDSVHGVQEDVVADPFTAALELVQLSEFGEIDPDIRFAFEPLWQATESEKGALRKANADTAAVYIADGVLDPREERERLAAEDDGVYQGLDLSVMPEPPDEALDPSLGSGMREPHEGAPEPIAGDEANFVESEHPRAPDGKFGSGASSGAPTKAKVPEKPKPKPSESSPKTDRALLKHAVTKDGKRVQADGSPLPAHIQKLKLPPAWTDVKFSDDPGSALQAQGKDAKGRLQSVYSDEFVKTQAAAKFSRVNSLMEQFPAIERQNAEGMKSTNPRIKDAADCLDLIMKMGVRPGSDDDTGADKKAYGATTLQGQHVVQENGETYLRFTGKKGVALNLKVDDPTLANALAERAGKAGAEGPLFPNVTDKSLLDYTHTMGDGSFKTKDFRTHLGTATAVKLVSSMDAPKTAKDRDKAVKAVAEVVSKKLGNTPSIALNSYINPTVFDSWKGAA